VIDGAEQVSLNLTVRFIDRPDAGRDHGPRPGGLCPVPVRQADALPHPVYLTGLGQEGRRQLRFCQPENGERGTRQEFFRIQPGALAHPRDPLAAVRLRNMQHGNSLASQSRPGKNHQIGSGLVNTRRYRRLEVG
jgi:hypothetical protein